MEILQLKYFCDSAESENFSKTAYKYNVPPSNISQAVHRLETEIGVNLFDRTSNKVILNECGRRFYNNVKIAMQKLDDACKEVRDDDINNHSEIKLKVCTNRRIVFKAIENFKKIYPDVNFMLSHYYNDKGEFDLIISDITDGEGVMNKELLVREKIYVASKKDNPMINNNVTLGSLKNERFISMPEKSSIYYLTERICSTAGFEPNIAIKCDDPYYLRRYVELGLGIAFVPSFSWQGQFSDDVVYMDVCDFYRNTYVIYDSNRYMTKAVKQFKNILFELCK